MNRLHSRLTMEVLLEDLLREPRVLQMTQYIQHGSTTTYDHCVAVAFMADAIAVHLHLRVNRKRLATAALLHDFYLYDWHITKLKGPMHGFAHPAIAQRNAARLLGQPPEVTEIIRTHMWPLTLRSHPTSMEGWVVCLADKLVAAKETIQR